MPNRRKQFQFASETIGRRAILLGSPSSLKLRDFLTRSPYQLTRTELFEGNKSQNNWELTCVDILSELCVYGNVQCHVST